MAANIIVIGALITYYVLMSKFLFGAGISIYKMQAVDNTTIIKPFVDDVNCIAYNLERTGVEVPENLTLDHVDIKWSFDETYWGINSSVPLYILVIFGLCMVRDPTFFARFSAFGTVTVILILFTAFYKIFSNYGLLQKRLVLFDVI
jgi:sodium-coupled neutral amino acid transporter 9